MTKAGAVRLAPRGDLETVLLVHNRYRQPGGEDVVFDAEAEMLESRGHRVVRFEVDNSTISQPLSLRGRARLAARTIWSGESVRHLRAEIGRHGPSIVHAHNTFPLISPSVYSACKAMRVPVVQTLHNYRLICPVATLFRDGHPCEDCVGRRIPWPGVAHRCYRSSHTESAVVAAMLSVHRARGTWTSEVDAYIALTEFARQRFIDGGLPAERITVKSHFVDPDPGTQRAEPGRFVFVGRLSEEKGVRRLLDAWRDAPDSLELTIAGDGPLRRLVQDATKSSERIRYLGFLSRPDTIRLLGTAFAVIVPSEWYEGHPLPVLEAFATGRPVIAARIGSIKELVDDGRTGLLFRPGDTNELRRLVAWSVENPDLIERLGSNARSEYLNKYTAERNYQQLLSIYRGVLRART